MTRKFCEKHVPNVYDRWCYKCRQLNTTWLEKNEVWVAVIGIVLFFVVLAGIRVTWANIVFDDWRCAFGECRFIK